MINKFGIFTVSLDFELYWGIRDKKNVLSYKKNLVAARKIIPILLDLFKEYEINATWGIVGFLFFANKEQLLNNLPNYRVSYDNAKLNPYLDVQRTLSTRYDIDFWIAKPQA